MAADIEEFVLQKFNPPSHQLEAFEQILDILYGIADDPLSAGTTIPGPYPGLKAVKKFEVNGVGYFVRIAYQFSLDEEAIEVVGFKQQLL